MIKYGANIDEFDSDYLTPLHLAIISKNAPIVQVLIDAGANINLTCGGASYPIHLAIDTKNIEIIQILILAGANLDLRNGDHMTPLHRAIFLKRADIVQILLNAGADFNLNYFSKNIFTLIYINYSQEVENVVNEFLTCFHNCRSRSRSISSTF